jgi:peroxiredoxin Q/BCP
MTKTTLLGALVVAALSIETARGLEMLAAGDPIPSWTLKDHTGEPVSSSDLKGRTYLLWFYPRAMTPGCTVEGRSLRDSYEKFQERGVVILGVSFDEPESNAQFVREEQFPFKLLSDTDRSLATRVGAADSASQGAARRISYLVGPDGEVLRAYPSVDPQTHVEQVLSGLDELPPSTKPDE